MTTVKFTQREALFYLCTGTEQQTREMMRSLFILLAIVAAMTTAFSPSSSKVSRRVQSISSSSSSYVRTSLSDHIVGRRSTSLNIDLGEPEREKLTRDTEPDEFFSTNTDKMSDSEKLPIAIAGLVGISLPFILGLIALYAAK